MRCFSCSFNATNLFQVSILANFHAKFWLGFLLYSIRVVRVFGVWAAGHRLVSHIWHLWSLKGKSLLARRANTQYWKVSLDWLHWCLVSYKRGYKKRVQTNIVVSGAAINIKINLSKIYCPISFFRIFYYLCSIKRDPVWKFLVPVKKRLFVAPCNL